MKLQSIRRKRFGIAACLALPALAALTGCQVDIAGQTLPSPYWLSDDVQYFAPGPEFKLSKEAATMEAERGEPGAIGAPTSVPTPGSVAPGGAAPMPVVPIGPAVVP